jgi:hypothetical protein
MNDISYRYNPSCGCSLRAFKIYIYIYIYKRPFHVYQMFPMYAVLLQLLILDIYDV